MSRQSHRARSRAPFLLRVALVGLFSSSILFGTSVSLAEPTAQDRALAETLFRDAKPLVDAGKYDEACPKLEESQRLDPKPGTMLNLAVCRDKQGKVASAWSDYLEAASLASRNNQKDREAFARQRAAELEKDLPRLAVVVSEKVPGIAVKLDGALLNEAAWGSLTPIDPGEHTIEALAQGFVPYSAKLTIAPGAQKLEHAIPKLAPEQAHPPDVRNAPPPKLNPPPSSNPPPPLGSTEPKKDTVAPAGGMPAQRIAGFVVGGVGVAGLALGSVFGVKTLSARDDSGCKESSSTSVSCTPEGKLLYEDAQQFSLLSTVGFTIGVAGLVTGTILVLTSPKPSKMATTTFVAPILGPSVQGLGAFVRF